MSLADPQTVTIGGTTSPLPRTSTEGDDTIYSSADGLIKLRIAHSLTGGKRARRMIRIDQSKLSADPTKPAENISVGMGIHVVFDVPPNGFTVAEQLALWVGLKTQITASSDAIVSKVLAGES